MGNATNARSRAGRPRTRTVAKETSSFALVRELLGRAWRFLRSADSKKLFYWLKIFGFLGFVAFVANATEIFDKLLDFLNGSVTQVSQTIEDTGVKVTDTVIVGVNELKKENEELRKQVKDSEKAVMDKLDDFSEKIDGKRSAYSSDSSTTITETNSKAETIKLMPSSELSSDDTLIIREDNRVYKGIEKRNTLQPSSTN